VKGIGAVRARAIVGYRMTHGEFKSIEDMVHVTGIGPRTLEKVRTVLTTVDRPHLGL
jgi:competence protein ComEA